MPQNGELLSRLCHYYADCLRQDSDFDGVEADLIAGEATTDYVEISALPYFETPLGTILENSAWASLEAAIRAEKKSLKVFLGYPVNISPRVNRSSPKLVVEPILLFPLNYDARDSNAKLEIATDVPRVNPSIFKSQQKGRVGDSKFEALTLADDLGLNERDDEFYVEDTIWGLQKHLSDFDWKEELNPKELANSPLSMIKLPGIYNRAVLITAEDDASTFRLLQELDKLSKLSPSDYLGTALGDWLALRPHNKAKVSGPLLQVLPLNSEQELAVSKALTDPLTVITGPPGTGKSQVVASITANAAHQGQSVFLTSYNHKAVDVVKDRINKLSTKPTVLRLGVSDIKSTLTKYITEFLAAGQSDFKQQYKNKLTQYTVLLEKKEQLDNQLEHIASLVNEIKQLAEYIQPMQKRSSPQQWEVIRKIDTKGVLESLSIVEAQLIKYNLKKRSTGIAFLDNWLNRSNKATTDAFIEANIGELRNFCNSLSLAIPHLNTPDKQEWSAFKSQIIEYVNILKPVGKYSSLLQKLQKQRRLEEIDSQSFALQKEVSKSAAEVFRTWVSSIPQTLSVQTKQALQELLSLVQIIITDTGMKQRDVSPQLLSRFYKLMPQLKSIMPCWAVTMLSAGRDIPFAAGILDLLILDEASQCNIPSILPLLYRTKRAVIIGDPQQLKFIHRISNKVDLKLLEKHGLLEENLNWAFSLNSPFELARSFCHADNFILLKNHHRSHSDIINFSNQVFYDQQLRVATSPTDLKLLDPNLPSVRWINVPGNLEKGAYGGWVNEQEAAMVARALYYLTAERQYSGTIGVVTPFQLQVQRIREHVVSEDYRVMADSLTERLFMVNSAHGYQGDERDAMIFSLTIDKNISPHLVKFLNNNKNLFNVAITRAKSLLLVVGDIDVALNCDIPHLVQFAKYVKELEQSNQEQRNIVKTESYGADYPAVARPELVSDIERTFYKYLYECGLRPIPQFNEHKYILDFAVVAKNRRLNVEVDGKAYHATVTGELCRQDRIRNQHLSDLGWEIMRFWACEIQEDPQACAQKVLRWYREHS